MLQTAFNGLCMALADSVPGVSGGTIAFILGFYDRFIDALHDLFGLQHNRRKKALRYLTNLGAGWVVGMGVCAILLAGLFTRNIYFMSSLFLGLTAASLPFIILSERQTFRELRYLPFALLGGAVVVALSLLRSGTGMIGALSFSGLSPFQWGYVFLSGVVAIAAMVLPGISGSTILLIAGVYLPAIQAIRSFLTLHWAVIPGLMALGLGILCGIALSIHLIRQALQNHHSLMLWLILGLIIGSFFAIVMGPTTLTQPLPALGLDTFRPSGFLLGVAILFGLELLRYRLTPAAKKSAPMKKEAVSHES